MKWKFWKSDTDKLMEEASATLKMQQERLEALLSALTAADQQIKEGHHQSSVRIACLVTAAGGTVKVSNAILEAILDNSWEVVTSTDQNGDVIYTFKLGTEGDVS